MLYDDALGGKLFIEIAIYDLNLIYILGDRNDSKLCAQNGWSRRNRRRVSFMGFYMSPCDILNVVNFALFMIRKEDEIEILFNHRKSLGWSAPGVS